MAKKKKKYLTSKDRKLIQGGVERGWKARRIALVIFGDKRTEDTIKHEIENYSVDGVYDAVKANKLAKRARQSTREKKYKSVTDRERILRMRVAEWAILSDLCEQVYNRPIVLSELMGLEPNAIASFGSIVGGETLREKCENEKKLLGVSLSPNTMKRYYIPLTSGAVKAMSTRNRSRAKEPKKESVLNHPSLEEAKRMANKRIFLKDVWIEPQDGGGRWDDLSAYLCLFKFLRELNRISRFNLNAERQFYAKCAYEFKVDFLEVPRGLIPPGYEAATRFRINNIWQMTLFHWTCRFESAEKIREEIDQEIRNLTLSYCQDVLHNHFVGAFCSSGKNPAGDGVSHIWIRLKDRREATNNIVIS